MVDVLSTTPARLFGMPRKGAIEAGRDADLVLFNPVAPRAIRQADLHHTSDFTPYEGMQMTGVVRQVFVRGADVIRDGRHVGTRGQGQYVSRILDLTDAYQPPSSRSRRWRMLPLTSRR